MPEGDETFEFPGKSAQKPKNHQTNRGWGGWLANEKVEVVKKAR